MKKLTTLMLFVLVISAILTACAQPAPTEAPAAEPPAA
jgi:ABC-type glycerol-3-phosphate transport system substrate-binding protein